MKQQFLSFLILLLPMVASADDSGKCGEGVTWNYNESTQTLTISGNGMMTEYDYMINPAERAPWYNYNADIRQLIIEDGVTNIGSFAFNGCSALTSLNIGNNVTYIGSYAFSGCISLTSIVIPNSVSTINFQAFLGCEELTSVTIPSNLTSLDPEAFYKCSNLKSIYCSDIAPWLNFSLKDIFRGAQIFINNKKIEELTSITIPEGISSIRDYVFSDFINITKGTSIIISFSLLSDSDI